MEKAYNLVGEEYFLHHVVESPLQEGMGFETGKNEHVVPFASDCV